jgi:hypothetical protein
MTLFGADLPRPSPEEAVVYLLGPGVGESIVLALPDGRFVVVDVCQQAGTNLPLALLDHLGAASLDLMIVTHPDLDHVRGLADIIQTRPPEELWRYPLEASIRDFIADWARRRKQKGVEADLRAMGDYLRSPKGDVSAAAYGNLEWPSKAASYKLRAIAPTECDKDRASRVFMKRLLKNKVELDAWLDRISQGSAPGDSPNVLSVAVLFELGAQRVLFGGDVLTGARSPKSGWKGILRLLLKHDRGHPFEDLAAVKLPHHGSRGAFEPTTWALHSKSSKPIAIAAPFSPSELPDKFTLNSLRPLARNLLVSSSHNGLPAFAASGGWAAAKATVLSDTAAPLVGLRMNAKTSTTNWFVSKSAFAFA